MAHIERRSALKAAGAAALATALSAATSAGARGADDEKRAAAPAPRINAENLTEITGIVTSVSAGQGQFNFVLTVGSTQMPFGLKPHAVDQAAVAVITMAYSKGLPLNVFYDNSAPTIAVLVSA